MKPQPKTGHWPLATGHSLGRPRGNAPTFVLRTSYLVLPLLLLLIPACQSPQKPDIQYVIRSFASPTSSSQTQPVIAPPKPDPKPIPKSAPHATIVSGDAMHRVSTPHKNTKPLTLTVTYPNSEFRIQNSKFQTQALNCDNIAFLKIAITGIAISTPLYPTSADGFDMITAGCSSTATINTVPFGNARIVTVTAYDTGRTLIPGSTIKAVFSVSATPTNVDISYRTTPAGDVVEQIINNPNPLIANHMNLTDLQNLVDNIIGASGTFPNFTYTTHPTLVNGTNIANDLLGNGGDSTALNPANAAYKVSPGTVTGTIAGLASTDVANVQVSDPASDILTDVVNGGFTINGAEPGNWTVTVTTGAGTSYTASGSPAANVTSGGSVDVGTITLTPATPGITGLSFSQAQISTSTTNINGVNFHSNADGNVVKFGNVTVPSGDITVLSDRQLEVKVPDCKSEPVTVNVGGQSSNAVPFVCQKWAFNTGGNVSSSPAIATDGTVYVGSFDLYAINPDGSMKWFFITGAGVYSSPAIATDGTVYVGSLGNGLYAINPDGTQKWNLLPGCQILSSPAIGADGVVYVGCRDNALYAVNPDGSLKWSFPTGIWVDSSPAIGADGTIYVGSMDGKVYAINPDGTQKWAFPTGGGVVASPAIASDGTVYIGSLDTKLYAINPNGSQKWAFPTGDGVYSSPAIASDGTIYVGSNDNKLHAINPDGSPKWTFSAGDNVISSPAIASDGTIYVGSDDNKLYAINPDGSQKWAFTTGNFVVSNPAIAPDGTVYVGSDDGKLYAINTTSSGLANSEWPKFHQNNINRGLYPLFISGFSPVVGGDATAVTITGERFTGATAVQFNGTNAGGFTVDSDTQITATAPGGVTAGAITVDAPSLGIASGLYGFMTLAGGNFAVSTAANDQLSPMIAYNTVSNEYLITWQDFRNGGVDFNIYAQRVDIAGNLIGGDFSISTAPNSQLSPTIAYNPTANEYLITWRDDRNGNWDIYAQRVNSAGSLVGGNFAISTDANNQNSPTITYNAASNEYLITWEDDRNGNWDIYAQRIDSAGNLVGVNFSISTAVNIQTNPTIAYNPTANEYLITWRDFRNGNNDIYAQRVDAAGNLVGSNFSISTTVNTQTNPTIAYNGTSNEYLVTWWDDRNGNWDIYAQRVDGAGNLIGGDFAISTAANEQRSPTITYNPTANEYLITWDDRRNGNNDIYAQRVDSAGNLVGSNFSVTTDANGQINPTIAYNATGNEYLITWQDERNGVANRDIYAQRVDAP